jgi:hypothetical protein
MVKIVPRTAAPYRPRVAPETRRLLIAAGIALATLWGLARIRFPDTPVTSSPVPPLLAQLSPPPTFETLAAEVARVQGQVRTAIVTIRTGTDNRTAPRPALRIRPGVAAAILPDSATRPVRPEPSDVTAADPATGLALVRLPDAHDPDPLPAWTPPSLDGSQFFLVTETSMDGQASLVPVFVGGMRAESSRAWHQSIWRLPPGVRVAPGAFVFSTHGELAGVAIEDGPVMAVVPADVFRAAAAALVNQPPRGGGWLGIDVAPLTPALARATGGQDGVIVSWVDPKGPAAGMIAPGDVIISVDSIAMTTPGQWEAATGRFAPGADLSVRVRSNGAEADVTLTAAAPPPAPSSSLGLHLRRVARSGSEVTGVDPGSAAALAGLHAGDVITRAANFLAPTPAELRSAYRMATSEHPLLIAVTRGAEHHVVALQP